MPLMKVLTRAVLWAALGSLTGVLLWSVLGATVSPFYYGQPSVREFVLEWPLGFLITAFWASVIGAAALPVYVAVFACWQLLVQWYPALEATRARQLSMALVLGAPPALIVTWSFSTSLGDPFDWVMAAQIFLIALLSCWGAVALPRLLLRSLRVQPIAPADQPTVDADSASGTRLRA